MQNDDPCRNCDGLGVEPFLTSATGGSVPCQTCDGRGDEGPWPEDGEDPALDDWTLPDDETPDPDTLAEYDGTAGGDL